MGFKKELIGKLERIKFFGKNIVSPLFNLIVSTLLFTGGWYLTLYTDAFVDSAYWMLGLLGFYFSYKSFQKSKYFKFLE